VACPVCGVRVCVCGLDEYIELGKKLFSMLKLLNGGVLLVEMGDVAHEVVVDLVHHWHLCSFFFKNKIDYQQTFNPQDK